MRMSVGRPARDQTGPEAVTATATSHQTATRDSGDSAPRPTLATVTSHRPQTRGPLVAGAGENPGERSIRRRGRREAHAAGAGGGGVEERVRRAAQRRRLPGVGHHVREGAARAEPAQPSSGHQQSNVLHSAPKGERRAPPRPCIVPTGFEVVPAPAKTEASGGSGGPRPGALATRKLVECSFLTRTPQGLRLTPSKSTRLRESVDSIHARLELLDADLRKLAFKFPASLSHRRCQLWFDPQDLEASRLTKIRAA